ncbi:MAG TPA: SPOR domain-containing protein [Oleiagrimonas sp.]|nr:SPOR domain-containing protein [Oleiagrimonas sp.]
MARKGRQAVRNGGWPAWLLVLIGIIIGAIGMGIVNHTGHMPISRSDNGPQPTADTTSSDNSAGIAANAQPQKPRYDFYSVLPEKEVVIPDAQIDAQARAEQQAGTTQGNTADNSTQTTASGNSGNPYLLQVGSFPNASDAEALKAKLALQGFRADIQPVTINGQTWNRVRLGPYSSASALETAKNKLEAAGIHAIALKEQ